MITIEYSTMCLDPENYLVKIQEARELVTKSGFNFGVQLHNTVTRQLFDKVLELKNEIPLTVHSPVFTGFFLNLAEKNFDNIKNTAEENIKCLKLIPSALFFFHGFFMTDKRIPNDMMNFSKIMKESMDPKYQLHNSIIMDPEFFDSDEFYRYRENFKAHYGKLKEIYPDYTISLENDFPGIGCGIQRPREIIELVDHLWLDISHLWCSSLLHDFDFYQSIDLILAKKEISGAHINHNMMTKKTPKENIKDSHTHLYIKNEQNLKPIVRKLIEKKIPVITLEIINGDIEDIKTLLDWINS